MTTTSRRGAALTAAALAWSVLGFGAAGPASAHTELESSSPANGQVLKDAPQRAKLTFSEAVTPIREKFALRGNGGTPIDIGPVRQAGRSVIVPFSQSLDDGAYLLSYAVTSDDGHAVKGTISFRVQQ
jgi:methionine-rich copper-binding protein CopC